MQANYCNQQEQPELSVTKIAVDKLFAAMHLLSRYCLQLKTVAACCSTWQLALNTAGKIQSCPAHVLQCWDLHQMHDMLDTLQCCMVERWNCSSCRCQTNMQQAFR